MFDCQVVLVALLFLLKKSNEQNFKRVILIFDNLLNYKMLHK